MTEKFLPFCPLNKHCFWQLFKEKSTSVEVQESAEKFLHMEWKHPKLYPLKRIREQFTILTSSLSQVAELGAKRPSWPMISPMGEQESVGVSALLPQLCRMLSRRPTSFLCHPEYQGELYDWGVWRSRESNNQGSNISKRNGSYRWLHRLHQEACMSCLRMFGL